MSPKVFISCHTRSTCPSESVKFCLPNSRSVRHFFFRQSEHWFDGEETHLGVGGYPERFSPASALAEFQASIDDVVDLRKAKQIERRGGYIPVGGVLRHIANTRGLLIGDAAGAVSPLTAGGLDPCMRLSAFAAKVVAEYLSSDNPQALDAYSGELFRKKFASRLWARRIAATLSQRQLLELTCAVLRLPLLHRLARHIFFGRRSFPDVK